MSIESVVRKFSLNRSYCRKNILHLTLTDYVNLGDGDLVSAYLEVHVNLKTSVVSLGHSVSSSGSGKVYPRTNSGKVDLACIPRDVVSRYESYGYHSQPVYFK